LDQFESELIKKVIHYCELVEYIPFYEFKKPIPKSAFPNNLQECIKDPVEMKFILEQTQDQLLNLLLVHIIYNANFMNIKRLLELCCLKIAFDFKGKKAIT